MYENHDFWPFKCPNCRNEFTEQIGRINSGVKVICPECFTWLADYDKRFAVILTEARSGNFDPWEGMLALRKSPT